MRTSITEARLLVVSDIHLGNPLHHPRRRFMEFLRFAIQHDYSICINGDGVDIVQMSLSKLTGDLSPCLGLFMRWGHTGRHIYYTVGNHDIALEHFLADVGRMAVVPFLNVRSADKRIRIEHGHMYDGMFLRFPRLYSLFTFIGRMAIGVSPGFYDALHRFNLAIIDFAEFLLSGFKTRAARSRSAGDDVIAGERDCFSHGAESVSVRGFDAVIFGHTHLPGTVRLASGVRYYNTGGWFTDPWCVAIDQGRIWFGPVTDLVAKGDPFSREPTEDASVDPMPAVHA